MKKIKKGISSLIALTLLASSFGTAVYADDNLIDKINSAMPNQLKEIVEESYQDLGINVGGNYKLVKNSALIYNTLAMQNYEDTDEFKQAFNAAVDTYVTDFINIQTYTPSSWTEVIPTNPSKFFHQRTGSWDLRNRPFLTHYSIGDVDDVAKVELRVVPNDSFENLDVTAFENTAYPQGTNLNGAVNNKSDWDAFYEGFNSINDIDPVDISSAYTFDITSSLESYIVDNAKISVETVASNNKRPAQLQTGEPEIYLIITNDLSGYMNTVNTSIDTDAISLAVAKLVDSDTLDVYEADEEVLASAIADSIAFNSVSELEDFINNYNGVYLTDISPENYSSGVLDNIVTLEFNTAVYETEIAVTEKVSGNSATVTPLSDGASVVEITIDDMKDSTVYCIDLSGVTDISGVKKVYFKTGWCQADAVEIKDSGLHFKRRESGKVNIEIYDSQGESLSTDYSDVSLSVAGADLSGNTVQEVSDALYKVTAEVPGTQIKASAIGVIYANICSDLDDADVVVIYAEADTDGGYVEYDGNVADISAGKHQVVFTDTVIYVDGEEYMQDSVATAAASVLDTKGYDTIGQMPTAVVEDITGDNEVHGILESDYTYSDADSDPESGTTTYWASANSRNGAYTEISTGVSGKTLTVGEDLAGKYVKFVVIPANAYETSDEEFSSTPVHIEKVAFVESDVVEDLSNASPESIQNLILEYADEIGLTNTDDTSKLEYPEYFYELLCEESFTSFADFKTKYDLTLSKMLKSEKLVQKDFLGFHGGNGVFWRTNTSTDVIPLNCNVNAVFYSLFDLSELKSNTYLSSADVTFTQGAKNEDTSAYFLNVRDFHYWSGNLNDSNTLTASNVNNNPKTVLYDSITTAADFPLITRDVTDAVSQAMASDGHITFEYSRSTGSNIAAQSDEANKTYITLKYDITGLLNDVNNAQTAEEIEQILGVDYKIDDYADISDKQYINAAILEEDFATLEQLEAFILANKYATSQIQVFKLLQSSIDSAVNAVDYNKNSISFTFNSEIASQNVTVCEKETVTSLDVTPTHSGATLTIAINEDMKSYTMYKVDLSSVQDADENTVSSDTFYFRTGIKADRLNLYKTQTAYSIDNSANAAISAFDGTSEILMDPSTVTITSETDALVVDSSKITAQYRGVSKLSAAASGAQGTTITGAVMAIVYQSAKTDEFEDRDDISLLNVRSGNAALQKTSGKEKILSSAGDIAQAWIFDDLLNEGYVYLNGIKVGMTVANYTVDGSNVAARTYGWHQIVFDMRVSGSVDVYIDAQKVATVSHTIGTAELYAEAMNETLFDSFGIYETSGVAPVADDVVIRGNAKTGETLTLEYTYKDADGDKEEGTSFKWLYSSSKNGTYTEISGATQKTYTVASSMAGKYIKAVVIPRNHYYTGIECTEYPAKAVLISSGKKDNGSDKPTITNPGINILENYTPSNSDNEDKTPDATGKLSFSDVDSSHWAYNSVMSLASKGIVNGYEDKTFKPSGNVTRAEFVCALMRALGIAEAGYDGRFSDVNAADWHSGYIAAAIEKGIINGFEDATFAPGDMITREQIAVIISKALSLANTTELAFADTADIGEWASDAVSKVAADGIMQGRDGNLFAPKANATRAEMAVLLDRILQR